MLHTVNIFPNSVYKFKEQLLFRRQLLVPEGTQCQISLLFLHEYYIQTEWTGHKLDINNQLTGWHPSNFDVKVNRSSFARLRLMKVSFLRDQHTHRASSQQKCTLPDSHKSNGWRLLINGSDCKAIALPYIPIANRLTCSGSLGSSTFAEMKPCEHTSLPGSLQPNCKHL